MPCVRRHLVGADVDITRWEKFENLCKNFLNDVANFFICGIEAVVWKTLEGEVMAILAFISQVR